MRKTVFTGIVLLALAGSLVGCSQTADPATPDSAMSDSTMSPGPSTSTSPEAEDMTGDGDDMMAADRSGAFAGLNGKQVAGEVTVSGTALTLSGFSSDEGPDLHVYLTNGRDEAAVAAGMRIDAVAYDQASQTFMLDGIDVAGYTDVVIHCDKAKAVFGAASLS
ncbi:DM13 domain-containing protein [Microbacterium resistens]|uniref:DM13 domain-containing protein n=1 Tax=Microbacterium resistens TaxID=156977 RepID=UPI001C574AC1|nr:DM13 domain-containing protein [Microbacterium resistens]MBW1638632.1 DM13 domain-containing protein [Microbacterium resistens]